MLGWAVVFLIIALVPAIFGFGGISGHRETSVLYIPCAVRDLFDFLRTCVPGDHVAVRIHQVNGVLLDAIHQNVELFGGVVQYGATGPIFRHLMRRKFSHTIRTFSLIRFPGTKTIFVKK